MQNRNRQTTTEDDIPIEVRYIIVDSTNSPTLLERKKHKDNLFYLNFGSLMLFLITLIASIIIILIGYVIVNN